MITMKIEGLKDLERDLIALGEKVGTKVLREAGRAALQPVLLDMQTHAGYDGSSSGEHMRDSIKVRSTSKSKNPNTVVTLRVGPSKKHRMKAIAQEFGTIKQSPKAFIRPALDYNKMKVLRILAVEIREGITRSR
ncbi:HK97-gp10 family putative phage morphogenesis protein [Budvicia aquatica]|uniref:Phage protein, HK97 gp10 family n=1 Tax=Budvicia aquatica TaxID=82979 RepID=A0A2C6DQG5_9GAMM|nr:HK97-gp10 family putative phage morphogenesis protein [Budvicia aquatica]PHI31034.1 hypothetical protein CRN84_17685 [Budvicia aquatica]